MSRCGASRDGVSALIRCFFFFVGSFRLQSWLQFWLQARHHACDRLLGLQSSASRQGHARACNARATASALALGAFAVGGVRVKVAGADVAGSLAWTSPCSSKFALLRPRAHGMCLGPLFGFCLLGQPAALVRPHAVLMSPLLLHNGLIAAACCIAAPSTFACHAQAIGLCRREPRSRCTSPGAPVYARRGPWCRERQSLTVRSLW